MVTEASRGIARAIAETLAEEAMRSGIGAAATEHRTKHAELQLAANLRERAVSCAPRPRAPKPLAVNMSSLAAKFAERACRCTRAEGRDGFH